MSYVKDLMAAAAKWTKLNPSASGTLKVPRDEFLVESDDLDRLFADFEKTARKRAANDPARSAEILANLERVRAQHDEFVTAQRLIREHEDAVENSVNDTEGSGHAKLDMGSGYAVATTPLVLGRWCLAWAYAGYNVFELSNDFVAAMLLTDPREIRTHAFPRHPDHHPKRIRDRHRRVTLHQASSLIRRWRVEPLRDRRHARLGHERWQKTGTQLGFS